MLNVWRESQIPKHIKRGKSSWERSYAELMGTVIICIFRMLHSERIWEQQLQPVKTTRGWQAEGSRTHNLKGQKSPGRALMAQRRRPSRQGQEVPCCFSPWGQKAAYTEFTTWWFPQRNCDDTVHCHQKPAATAVPRPQGHLDTCRIDGPRWLKSWI